MTRHDLRKYKPVHAEATEDADNVVTIGYHTKRTEVRKRVVELLRAHDHVVLKGSGAYVSTVVEVAEAVRRRVGGLYGSSKIVPDDYTQKYVLKEGEEGEAEVEVPRFRSGFHVCLSTQPLDKTAPGYQEPIPVDLSVKTSDAPEGKSKGRGQRQGKRERTEEGERPKSGKGGKGKGGKGKGGKGGKGKGSGRGRGRGGGGGGGGGGRGGGNAR